MAQVWTDIAQEVFAASFAEDPFIQTGALPYWAGRHFDEMNNSRQWRSRGGVSFSNQVLHAMYPSIASPTAENCSMSTIPIHHQGRLNRCDGRDLEWPWRSIARSCQRDLVIWTCVVVVELTLTWFRVLWCVSLIPHRRFAFSYAARIREFTFGASWVTPTPSKYCLSRLGISNAIRTIITKICELFIIYLSPPLYMVIALVIQLMTPSRCLHLCQAWSIKSRHRLDNEELATLAKIWHFQSRRMDYK